MNFLFAHSEELHETTVEAITHSLGPWYVATLVFIFTIFSVGYLTWLLSNSNVITTLIAEAVLLLIIGFIAAATYPLISVLAITIGIVSAGIVAFSGIASG